MVRVNIIEPRKLSDQHLVAEYLEILMLLGYVRKNSSLNGIPKDYVLGPGHIKFFKNKLLYLKNRHEEIKKEMQKRKFKTDASVVLSEFPKELINDWKPKKEDFDKIISRITYKINLKPNFYRYYGEYKDKEFFITLLDN